MMRLLVLIVFVIISVTAAPASDQDATPWSEENVGPAVEVEAEDIDVVPNNSTALYNEEACLRGGGTCLPEVECPSGKLSVQRGLCPLQQARGVECCHGLSVLETRCQARGGQCSEIATCSRALIEERAEDCPDEKICCVLVRS